MLELALPYPPSVIVRLIIEKCEPLDGGNTIVRIRNL